MKIKEIVQRQRERIEKRGENAMNIFGAERDLTQSQTDIAYEMGYNYLYDLDKDELIKKYLDPEDVIFTGLMQSL